MIYLFYSFIYLSIYSIYLLYVILHPFIHLCYSFTYSHNFNFFSDEMGLGKSLQALVTIALITLENKVERKRNNKENIRNDDANIILSRNISEAERNENEIKLNTKTVAKATRNKKRNMKDIEKTNYNEINNYHNISLVVCPASLTSHWKEEIMKFFPFGRILIPKLYHQNVNVNYKTDKKDKKEQKNKKVVDDNNKDNNDNHDNDNDNNDNDKNDNENENENDNENKMSKVDKEDKYYANVIIIASYDSVRRNKDNYFTNQVIDYIHKRFFFSMFLFIFYSHFHFQILIFIICLFIHITFSLSILEFIFEYLTS